MSGQPKEFVSYQKFGNKALAQDLADLLEKHQIEYRFNDASPTMDGSFGGGELSKEYEIQLMQSNFKKADELQLENAAANYETIDKDYYLFGFSDEELREIIVKKDEWNPFDFLLAQKLLKDRGAGIGIGEIETLRDKRLQELAKPEPTQSAAIIADYVLAILGGAFGIFTGWYLRNHKKTLPNGQRVYAYKTSDRAHGLYIMILGTIFLILGITFKFLVDAIHD
jgi:hypothetical protein